MELRLKSCLEGRRYPPLVVALLLFSTVAFAGPTIEKLQINGLEVFLVNTHQGNQATVAASIPTGAWYDPQAYAGRQHMLEHAMFLGSELYPHPADFTAISKKLGAETNASTDREDVFYFGNLHPRGLPEFISLLGSTLSRPLLKSETYAPEHTVVRAEIASYQSRDDEALLPMIFLSLLPPEHPLRMYDGGLSEPLSQLSIEDLRDLYYSNYGDMRVIVVANFDATGIDAVARSEVIGWIKKSFFKPKIPDGFIASGPLRDKVFPPLVNPQVPHQPRFVEIQQATHAGSIRLVFSADRTWSTENPGAYIALMDYLQLDVEGSLSDRLQDQDWLQGLELESTVLNGRIVIEVRFDLTEAGCQHRFEVVDYFFQTLYELQHETISPVVLRYLKDKLIGYDEINQGDTQTLAERVAGNSRWLGDPETWMSHRKLLKTVTASKINEAARRLFDLEEMIGGYQGSDVVRGAFDFDFKRHYQLIPFASTVDRWRTFANGSAKVPSIPPIDPLPGHLSLPRASQSSPSLIQTESPHVRTGGPAYPQDQILVQSQNQSSRAGLSIFFETAGGSDPQNTVAGDLFLAAFENHFKSELDALESLGIYFEWSSPLQMSVSGDARQVPEFVIWLVKKFKEFAPSASEIQFAKGEWRANADELEHDFSAQIAQVSAADLLWKNHLNLKEQKKIVRSFTAKKLRDLVQVQFLNVDLAISAVGNLSLDQVAKLHQDLRAVFPSTLSTLAREKNHDQGISIHQSAAFLRPMKVDKGDQNYGLSRTYLGPSLKDGLPAIAAFMVFGEALHDGIYELNRSQKGLGYVHGSSASYSSAHRRWKLTLYGETQSLKTEGTQTISGHERAHEISRGWSELMTRAQQSRLSENQFQGEISSLRLRSLLIPTDLAEAARLQLKNYLRYGDPGIREKLATVYSQLTPEFVYSEGLKYWGPDQPYLEVIAHHGQPSRNLGCGQLLLNENELRNALAGESP